jgi:hypothetical protein
MVHRSCSHTGSRQGVEGAVVERHLRRDALVHGDVRDTSTGHLLSCACQGRPPWIDATNVAARSQSLRQSMSGNPVPHPTSSANRTFSSDTCSSNRRPNIADQSGNSPPRADGRTPEGHRLPHVYRRLQHIVARLCALSRRHARRISIALWCQPPRAAMSDCGRGQADRDSATRRLAGLSRSAGSSRSWPFDIRTHRRWL